MTISSQLTGRKQPHRLSQRYSQESLPEKEKFYICQ